MRNLLVGFFLGFVLASTVSSAQWYDYEMPNVTSPDVERNSILRNQWSEQQHQNQLNNFGILPKQPC